MKSACISGFLAAVVLVSGAVSPVRGQGGAMPDYKNPNLLVERRVTDLLGRMTLEEKVAQTLCIWMQEDIISGDGAEVRVTPKGAEVLRHGLGEYARVVQAWDPKTGTERANAIQKHIMENTRLGIPVMFHEESLHGLMAKGATHFPQAIALAGTWDPELHHRIFSAAALEARARGVSHVLTPVLDLARDPRWGRVEETYGEDPFLAARMGVAAVRGFQGSGPSIDDNHVAATAKHFAVHGQPERGVNLSPANFSERVVRGEFLMPFEAVVTEGGVMSVMASYNEVDGIPSHANRWLLQNVLREEWGFRGFVVSDYSGIDHLHSINFVARDKHEAARQALDAGVDMELPDINCYGTLLEQVRDGRISEAAVDRAVERILRAKFLLGLFERPYADPERAVRVTNSPEHRALALEAARKSITLLKNDGGVLPLDRGKIKRLAVIGPNAAGVHLGGYSWEPREGVSVLDGIRKIAGGAFEVRYAEGCRITENVPSWFRDEVIPGDPARGLIAKGLQVNAQAAFFQFIQRPNHRIQLIGCQFLQRLDIRRLHKLHQLALTLITGENGLVDGYGIQGHPHARNNFPDSGIPESRNILLGKGAEAENVHKGYGQALF